MNRVNTQQGSAESATAYFAELAAAIAEDDLNLVMIQAAYQADGSASVHLQIYGDPAFCNRVNEIQAQVARRTGIQS